MDLYDAMRTTFSAREFTEEPLPDAVLVHHPRPRPLRPQRRQPPGLARHRRAGTRHARRPGRAERPRAAKRYAAQLQAGENPWNPVDRSSVDAAAIERTARSAPA